MNLPNKLTLSRVFVIPFFIVFLFADDFANGPGTIALFRWASFVLFIGAAITDYFDGLLARRQNLVTNFGQLFDPLADKLLTMSAFVAFLQIQAPPDRPIFPAWAIILILGREFLITGLRLVASAQGRIIGADRWGKHKTVSQLVCIIAILFSLCVRDTLRFFAVNLSLLDRLLPPFYTLLLAIVVILTVGSGATYLIKNWDLISDRE